MCARHQFYEVCTLFSLFAGEETEGQEAEVTMQLVRDRGGIGPELGDT